MDYHTQNALADPMGGTRFRKYIDSVPRGLKKFWEIFITLLRK